MQTKIDNNVDHEFKTIDDRYYYDEDAPIGRGTFGLVYEAFDGQNSDGPKLIVKPIATHMISEDPAIQQNLKRELDLISKIRGEHIVQLADTKLTASNLYIFYEYCDGGSLEDKIKAEELLSENEGLSLVKQIAETFLNLNLPNKSGLDKKVLMHRNIKPSNILFKGDKVKLGDFGFAKVIDDIDQNIREMHTIIESTLYSAPQILDFDEYSAKCDVWSTGIVLYEAIFGELPWRAKKVGALLTHIKTKPFAFPKTIKDDTKDLITNMLQPDEEKRFSWSQVSEHPALKNIKL